MTQRAASSSILPRTSPRPVVSRTAKLASDIGKPHWVPSSLGYVTSSCSASCEEVGSDRVRLVGGEGERSGWLLAGPTRHAALSVAGSLQLRVV